MTRKQIVFLMSDTGGGHRAAAGAVRAAMDQLYPDRYRYELVDVYRRYTPIPFKYMPELYPRWVNYAGASWGLGFKVANVRRIDRLVMAGIRMLWQRGVQRFVQEHHADVFVSVHSVLTRPVMHALKQHSARRSPFITVITDLVTAHAFWYEPEVERCLVPTQAAYERGISFGLRPDQLRVTGLPVHPRFVENLPSKPEARRRLGLDPVRTVVLLVGGGDGMGPVYKTARAIDDRRLDLQLVIVAGRNVWLRRRLETARWHQPTQIFPWVNNMADLMAAADILVTKAGPATISEACIAGLPIVLSGAVPGQEEGNVRYVVENGAGIYTPGPARVAAALGEWVAEGPEALARRAAQVRTLARPDAAWDIAREIHALAQQDAGVRIPPPGQRIRDSQPGLRPSPEEGWVL